MIYSIKGKLVLKQENYLVIDINGMAFKIASSLNTLKNLPESGKDVEVFTHLHVREDALDLYGFLDKKDLRLFKMFISVSGIVPKSALGILALGNTDKLMAAISEGRSELLTKASGVGKKTAERIILELRSKLKQEGSEKIVGLMEFDQDILEVLVNLGYTKSQSKEALERVDSKFTTLEDRTKEALKILKNK